jgi:16S rRNA (uracil1498-N3)-methyltransferase
VTDRYFSDVPISEGSALLAGSEAHHLIHVMRAKPGDRVVLFDGSGAEYAAQVQQIERSRVQLAVLSRQEVDRELPLELTLGVALPKGDRQRWLVEKAVELGVGRIVPLVTARTVAQPPVALASRQWPAGRLRRTVIEASKQCGRNRLMEIAQPRAWADYVADTADAPCRLLAQPGGHPMGTGWVAGVDRAPKRSFGRRCEALVAEPPVSHLWGRPAADHQPPGDLPGRVFLAVGPEGGFTDEEVSLAVAAGWQTIDLGPRILRAETAALLLVAMVVQSAVTIAPGRGAPH